MRRRSETQSVPSAEASPAPKRRFFERARARESPTEAASLPKRRLFSRANVHSACRYALGGGSILFSLMATTQPERVARAIDVDEEALRYLAIRDLSTGITLITGQTRLRPLVGRLRYFLRGARLLAKSEPALSGWSLLLAVIGAIAIYTRD